MYLTFSTTDVALRITLYTHFRAHAACHATQIPTIRAWDEIYVVSRLGTIDGWSQDIRHKMLSVVIINPNLDKACRRGARFMGEIQ